MDERMIGVLCVSLGMLYCNSRTRHCIANTAVSNQRDLSSLYHVALTET